MIASRFGRASVKLWLTLVKQNGSKANEIIQLLLIKLDYFYSLLVYCQHLLLGMNKEISILLCIFLNDKEKYTRPWRFQDTIITKDSFRNACIKCAEGNGDSNIADIFQSENFQIQRYDKSWEVFVDVYPEEIVDRDKVKIRFDSMNSSQVKIFLF